MKMKYTVKTVKLLISKKRGEKGGIMERLYKLSFYVFIFSWFMGYIRITAKGTEIFEITKVKAQELVRNF